MTKTAVKLLDVVALAEDLPDEGLRRGDVGTVVEVLEADVFTVEFSDDDGRTYAMPSLRTEQLRPLPYESVEVA